MKHSKYEVAAIVRQYLQDSHPGGANLDVVDSRIRNEEFAWHVPIQPDVEPSKLFEYYEALTDVENKLAEEAHLKVFLVPSEPKHETAA